MVFPVFDPDQEMCADEVGFFLALGIDADEVSENGSITQTRERINNALRQLTYREREITKLRLKFRGKEDDLTFSQIGSIFKISREQARQILKKSIQKLKNKLQCH